MRENIILWGAGEKGKSILKNANFFEDTIKIMGIVDRDPNKWGEKCMDIEILPPSFIAEVHFDKIVVSSTEYFDEIKSEIIEEMHVDDALIENRYYFAKAKLMSRYNDSQDDDIRMCINYLKNHRLDVFNYEFVQKYNILNADIRYDSYAEMYYVMHFGKKLYMSKKLNTKEKVLNYYRSICIEQDQKSPHAYLCETFDVDFNDVVVDVGAAEGNFSLQVIDKCSKIYMLETDDDWIESLKYTFAEYKDKVVIIQKFVSDFTFGNIDKLDNIVNGMVNFIKIDVEGYEKEVLAGAKKLIGKSDKFKCAVCAYHNDNDEVCINQIADELGLKGQPVKGYMWYPVGSKQIYISPLFRRGVIRYEKTN